MKNLKLNITQFRYLNNLSLDLGSPRSVIPVGNVTGNIYLLGLVIHIFRFDNFLKNIFNERFEIKYSSVFRFSFNHYTVGNYQHKLQISDNSEREEQLRLPTEYDRSRYRIVIEGVATLGVAFKFEEYGPVAWAMQGMAVYLICWAAVRMQESNS